MNRPSGPSRLLWPLLVASLSVNILLAAYAGTLWWRLNVPIMEATSPARVLERATSFLDEEDRAAALEAFQKREDDFTDSEGDVVEARDRLVALLQAEELDEEAIRAAFGDVHAARTRSFEMIVEAVIETVQAIPPDRRRELMAKIPPR